MGFRGQARQEMSVAVPTVFSFFVIHLFVINRRYLLQDRLTKNERQKEEM